MLYTTAYLSPLGCMLLAAEEEKLVGTWFEGQKYFGCPPEAERIERENAVLRSAKAWLDGYFAGEAPSMDVPLQMNGTSFQMAVWRILQKIPYGCTVTYGEIARQLTLDRGIAAMSAQAVGNAVGRNRLSVFVPCHRVLGAGGRLTGYAGGIDRKRALLSLEQVYIHD